MVKNMNIFNPKKILCPIDFSDLSSLALKYAAAAAVEFNAGLRIFHAKFFDTPKYFSRHEDEQLIQEIKKGGATVEKALRDHTEKILGTLSRKIPLDYGAVDRHPVEAILEAVETEFFDLIVMGTHGYSGLKRLFLGSVTENVIRNARVPVFTIRQKSHGFIDVNQAGSLPVIERMLCPCHPSEMGTLSLKTAVSIAQRFQAKLTVLFCVEEEDRGIIRREKEAFPSWVSKNTESQYPVNIVVCQGNTPERIISTAREEQSDMIVIGADHKPFMETSFLGRTTELVLRQAPAPVMAVPSFGMMK